MVVRSLLSFVAASTFLVGCGSPSSAPATVTVTQPTVVAAAPTSTSPPVSDVTIPDVTGQNAEIVREQLADLGLTEVSLASANPKYSVVVLATNWTVVSIEPPPGTVVKSDQQIVVKVYKD